jgi:hypothetical protein
METYYFPDTSLFYAVEFTYGLHNTPWDSSVGIASGYGLDDQNAT